MAKFRNGNLVLTSTQSIIHGSVSVIDSDRAGRFSEVKLDNDISITINKFTTDVTLAGDSDTAIPTEKAIKSYVDNKIAGSLSGGQDKAIAIYDGTSDVTASSIFIDGATIYSNNMNFQTGDSTSLIALSIDSNQIVTVENGALSIDGTTKGSGYLYSGSVTPTNTKRLNYDGYLYVTKMYNSVWNDIADFQKVADKKIPGKCYFDTYDGAKICTERCQKSVIGILSDTYGFGVGYSGVTHAPFAIAGWVLAYVDDECEPGDVLTNNEHGNLVKMTETEIQNHPERIVAIYKKSEDSEYWGASDSSSLINKIIVYGRHWVKVK